MIDLKTVFPLIMCIILLSGSIVTNYPYAKLTFFSVGDSDATLITVDGKTIVIDSTTEENFKILKDGLQAENVEKIDYFILTHFDRDHIGSASMLINSYKIGEIIIPNKYYAFSTDVYDDFLFSLQTYKGKVTELTKDYTFSGYNFSVSVYPSRSDYYFFATRNNSSLITKISIYGTDIFLLADIERDRVKECFHDGIFTQCDILKIPHHGIPFDGSDNLFKMLSPKVSVTTCSFFRHQRIINDKYNKFCGKMYFTDFGKITVSINENGYFIDQM